MRPTPPHPRPHALHTARFLRAILAIALLMTLAVTTPAVGVRATTRTVSNCNDDNSAGSLRGTLAAAAANDTINFNTDCTGFSDLFLGGTLTPTVNVTIDATGHTVEINGFGSTGIFTVNSGVTLTLRGLTLTNGYSNGGAVYNYLGTLNVTNCTFTANTTSSGNAGGAIYNSSGTATVTNSTFSNNSTGTYGGAIFNAGGTLNVSGSVFFNNSAGIGGAITNFTGSTLNVTGSAFSGNSASNSGGAIYNDATIHNVATMKAVNSTFSGNSAVHFGGAIDNVGAMNVVGSTLSGNAVTNSGDSGGGIHNDGTAQLALSVVAGNTASNGPDIYGSVTDNGGNVVGSNPAAPLLGPLAVYAPGTVQTFALLPGSAAIDLAACPTDPTMGMTLATDARGVARPQGGNCDAGAFESRGFALGTLTGNGQSAVRNTAFAAALGLTVSSANSEPVSGGQVTFTITPGAGGASATFPAAGGCTLTSATVVVCPINSSGIATTPNFTANDTPGAFTVVARATGAPAVTFSATVLPSPATHFAVTGFPASVVSGVPGTVTVTALDASNAATTGYTGTVRITSSDMTATLPPNATLTNGVGMFSVTLKTAGTQSITATDTVTSSITGVQSGITVTPALALPTGGQLGSSPGVAYRYTFAATGGTGGYIYAVAMGSSLLPGLTLDPATGTVSGTAPTTTGSYPFTLTVTDSSAATASHTYTLTVTVPNATPAPAPTHAASGMPNAAPPTRAPGTPAGAGTPTPLPQPARR